MNEDIFSGKWHQLKGKVKEKWGKLTDDDLTRINGKREQLLGSLEERYGWEKKRAADELERFEDSFYKNLDVSERESYKDFPKEKRDLYKGEDDEGEGKSKRRKVG